MPSGNTQMHSFGSVAFLYAFIPKEGMYLPAFFQGLWYVLVYNQTYVDLCITFPMVANKIWPLKSK
jgi:hypothetical protein